MGSFDSFNIFIIFNGGGYLHGLLFGPLLLLLLVLLGSLGQVGVIGQFIEERRHHGVAVHLLL